MSVSHRDRKMTPETLFHMASITKTFVATSIMQLWERGQVDLDAPVTTYVPYFRLADPRYKAITVRQMLTHSSGMPDVDDYEWNHPQYDDEALSRYVKGLADKKLKLLFDPGTGMSYSNMAYEVLGDLVAHVSGATFEDYVDANILQPLGMKSSTLLIKNADPALLADGYMRKRGGDYASLTLVKAYPYNRIHTPSSDLMSNVVDMTRYAMANLNHGELEGKRILKASTYDLLWRPTVEVEFCRDDRTQCRKPGAWVGISWFTQDKDGQTIVSHSGGDDGFMTDLVLVPRSNMGLVLMTNALAAGTTLPQQIVSEFLAVARDHTNAGR
jgi:CubicO group peptidase (beta-lactamase class C family)